MSHSVASGDESQVQHSADRTIINTFVAFRNFYRVDFLVAHLVDAFMVAFRSVSFFPKSPKIQDS